MAAYAALVSLLNNIHQIMNHPRLSTSLDNQHIQPLLEKAGFFLDFIEGYNYGGDSKEAEDLERQIASAAQAAEDMIESHIVDLIRGGTNEAWKMLRSLRRIWDLICGGCLPCSSDLQQIIEDMDAIMEKVTEVKKKRESRKEKAPTHPGPVMESGESGMVGLEDELLQLLDELTGHRCSRHTISIVGMGGMGKTTLAKNIYGNSLIKEHFDIRIWATITQQYNVEEILSQLLSGLGKSTSGTVPALGEVLYKTLYGRRYLIILDDIWSVEPWEKVRRYFPDDGNRSRVVLTTRLSNVANVCGSSCFPMNLLDEDKSWKLFCEKALFPQKDDPPQLAIVGKKIARLCKGLALSIVVIGGLLLKSPRTIQFWKVVAEDLESIPNSKEKQQSLDVLSLSYTHLPPHLKSCFLYMGVFKEDSHIRVSKIIKLWIAEGFIKPIGSRVLDELAEGYLKDLIDRNLILVVRHSKNGKIGSCGIHDLLRDLCIKVGEQQEFFHVNRRDMRGTERRFICDDLRCIQGTKMSLLRSIFTNRELKESVKHRLLRVLDEYGLRDSAEELYGNVNLRYLAYQLPFYHPPLPVWDLPTSVSLMWNLQTLIMNRGSRSSPIIVAFKIWNMRQLKHVKCYQIYLPDPTLLSNSQGDLLILDNLQTLKTVVNLRLCEEVCEIIPNIKKLHLLYDELLMGYDDSLIECLCNLDRLHKLESLNLSIQSSRWPTPDTELIMKLRFPRLLNKLSLSYFELRWEDLTVIGSLPQLEVLELKVFPVGQRWSPIPGQFCRLKFLKIDLCRLLYWDADNSHFPILEKLVLNNLFFLKEIPLGIGEIPTLGLIRVDNCSESTAISAVKIKEDQLESLENDGLQVQVRLIDHNLASLKKRMEIEGLTINNIEFL